MKEVVALCFGASLIIVSVYLFAQKSIDIKGLIALVGAAVVSGLAIANYDVLASFKAGNMEFKTARAELEADKIQAIEEIGISVAEHREQLTTLFRQGNELSDQLETQKFSLNERIEEAQALEGRLGLAELRSWAVEGSRSSYEKLLELSSQADFEYRETTLQAVDAVRRKYGDEFLYVESALQFHNNNTGAVVPLEEVPLEKIVEHWPSDGSFRETLVRKKVLDTLAKKGDVASIPYVIEKLREEENLWVCVAAVQCLWKLTGKDSERLDFGYWLSGDYKSDSN